MAGPALPGPREGHVLVCGLHDEGLRLVEQLTHLGLDAVVVDDQPDPRLVRSLTALGVPFVEADSRHPDTLAGAGLATCRALVCVEADDLHTLATALQARELRADVPVIVQLRNAAVGRALEQTGVAVLDVAGLATPSLVEACLQTGRWPLRLPELELCVVEATCVQPGSLRALYGDLAPVALLPAGSQTPELSPGRDTRVEPGDTVVVVGTPDAVDAAGLTGHARRTPLPPVFIGARAPRPERGRPSRLAATVSLLDSRARRTLGAIAGLATLSVVVLTLGYREPDGSRMSILDALYFTVETIATVGYGDFSFREQPAWLRLWAIALMAVGATLLTILFALLTNALVTRRLAEALGRRRITELDGHVVVVGMGTVGRGLALGLRERGADVVVVERDPDNRFASELRAAGVPVVVADATVPDTWEEVRLARARAVAVMTSDDLANLETGLAVKALLGSRAGRTPVVLRLFGRRMAGTVAHGFGFRHTRSPADLAAPWFVAAVMGLRLVDSFHVGRELLLVARLLVLPGAWLDGRTVDRLGADLEADLRVLLVVRPDGSLVHPPRRHDALAAGDTAYVAGPYSELAALLRAESGPAAG